MNKVIVIDLDGTLIDSRKRSHELFNFLTAANISFDDYWQLKYNGTANSEILKVKFSWSDHSIQEFKQQWKELIEDPRWLPHDALFHYTVNALNRLHACGFDLWLLTARYNPATLADHLQELDLKKYFKKVIAVGGISTKAAAVAKEVQNHSIAYVIGDSEDEIRAGLLSGIPVISVLSGVRSKDFLLKAGALQIENTIWDFASSLPL